MATKKTGGQKATRLEVKAPNFQVAEFHIRGTAPYVQHKFAGTIRDELHEKQAAGSAGRGTQERKPKDFEGRYEAAKHKSAEGWCGIPASAFRNALISACRLVGATMTRAKLAIFVEADGISHDTKEGLVRITKGEPHYYEKEAPNANGVIDLRPRPMWDTGWEAVLRVKFDADMFTIEDIANLVVRVSIQVGVGEGRHDSKNSCGLGWGTFEVLDKKRRAG